MVFSVGEDNDRIEYKDKNINQVTLLTTKRIIKYKPLKDSEEKGIQGINILVLILSLWTNSITVIEKCFTEFVFSLACGNFHWRNSKDNKEKKENFLPQARGHRE